MSKAKILIVEDDIELREALVTTIEMNGHQCLEAESAEAALPLLENSLVDLVVSDVNMPGMDGHALLDQIQKLYPGLPVILMTAYGQIRQAVNAIQAGAIDYMVKPFDPTTLMRSVNRVVNGDIDDDEAQPVAEDPYSRRLFQMANKVATTDSTVLISGESGTGKEVLARYIHAHSNRSKAPFVAINCAAIPENMLEAILFGHEKGAFTGAYASAPGKFEQANGGTLLLDEISEMELGLQAKLLRVLQEREVERVGGRKTIALNVRVLATTNRNLHEYVREGKFREDLFYRLSVFPMHWRPLRERPLDIVPLAEKLLTKHTRKMKLPSVNISTAAKTSLTEYHWPGNVRELDNALQRALILQQGNVIQADDLCLDMIGQPWMAMTAPVTTAMPASMVSESAQDAKRGESWDEFAVGTSGWIGENPTSSLSETEHFAGGAPQDSYKPEAPVDLGTDLKMREFQIIIDTIRQCRKRKLAAEKLGISPRTLRYKLAQMRDMGIDLETELALSDPDPGKVFC